MRQRISVLITSLLGSHAGIDDDGAWRPRRQHRALTEGPRDEGTDRIAGHESTLVGRAGTGPKKRETPREQEKSFPAAFPRNGWMRESFVC